jgi:hypothetical protein
MYTRKLYERQERYERIKTVVIVIVTWPLFALFICYKLVRYGPQLFIEMIGLIRRKK